MHESLWIGLMNEMITGGDFKRMVRGAFSEILLKADEINAWADRLPIFLSHKPGNDICRTMAAAVLPLGHTPDDSLGGLSRLSSAAAFLGARGTAGVMIASILRGLAKGLSGHYEANNSQFGRAFQYGILYAQRAIAVGEKDADAGVVQAARQVAKSARNAVRSGLSINDILEAALAASGSEENAGGETFGQFVMRIFLEGCKHGLDGNFVSPFIAAGSGHPAAAHLSETIKAERVDIFCLNLAILPATMRPDSLELVEKSLRSVAGHVEVSLFRKKILVHAHTAEPGKAIERCLAWGNIGDISIANMAEPHAMPKARVSLLKVAVVAITDDAEAVGDLQKAGAQLIITLREGESLTVGTIVGACHSDLAASYIIVGYSHRLTLLLHQVEYLLEGRAEIVYVEDKSEQLAAIAAFDASSRLATARDCAAKMRDAVENLRNG